MFLKNLTFAFKNAYNIDKCCLKTYKILNKNHPTSYKSCNPTLLPLEVLP